MKPKTTKTISALLLWGSTLAFGTGNDSLYMGNVGRINPSISQILIGEVQVSGIQSPAKLTLDLVLPDGNLYTVNDISVNQDGIYNIFEPINTMLMPQGTAILNISSDKNLSEKNILVDVTLQNFEEFGFSPVPHFIQLTPVSTTGEKLSNSFLAICWIPLSGSRCISASNAETM